MKPKAKAAASGSQRGIYWAQRRNMMYYDYVRALAGPLARDARSLIDVGSHSTSIAEDFDWVPERFALDLKTPYASDQVRGIQADFLRFEPERRYDFALCLQVLEHVPEADAFARKLLAVADRVLVSVPYKWPKGRSKHHCQDPVDRPKLASWFGREPDYSLIVEEPFRDPAISRRLIAYFHSAGTRFDRRHYNYGTPKNRVSLDSPPAPEPSRTKKAPGKGLGTRKPSTKKPGPKKPKAKTPLSLLGRLRRRLGI